MHTPVILTALSCSSACCLCWRTLYGRSRTAAAAAQSHVDVGWDLMPRDPAVAKQFYRYLADDTRQWCQCCGWILIVFALLLNVKFSQTIHPDRQSHCSQEQKFYVRLNLLVFCLVKLLPIDKAKDIRVRWMANLYLFCTHVYTWLGMSSSEASKLCLGEWLQDIGCAKANLFGGVANGAFVVWLPVGVHADTLCLVIINCVMYHTMSQHTDSASSSYAPGCHPLPNHHMASCIAMTVATTLKWYIYQLQLVRFLSSPLEHS